MLVSVDRAFLFKLRFSRFSVWWGIFHLNFGILAVIRLRILFKSSVLAGLLWLWAGGEWGCYPDAVERGGPRVSMWPLQTLSMGRSVCHRWLGWEGTFSSGFPWHCWAGVEVSSRCHMVVKIPASYWTSCDTLQHGREGYLIAIRWGQKSRILMWTPVTLLAVGVDSLLQVGMKILSPYLAFVGGSRVTVFSLWLE